MLGINVSWKNIKTEIVDAVLVTEWLFELIAALKGVLSTILHDLIWSTGTAKKIAVFILDCLQK